MIYASAQGETAATWLDLAQASDPERATVATRTGLTLRDAAALAEVETSSLLNMDGDANAEHADRLPRRQRPLARHAVAFVFTPARLVSIRAEALPVFDAYAVRFASAGSGSAFMGLLEAIVDRIADVNNGSTILTVVSSVGVPPTLVASI